MILYVIYILYVILKIYFKRFFLSLKGLSDGKVVSLTKKEYGSAVKFLYLWVQYLMNEQFVKVLFYLEFS